MSDKIATEIEGIIRRARLDRYPGSGNSADRAEGDAADVFSNRVTRKKKSRPEDEGRQN